MEITKTLIIQILSKEEFEKLLLEHLCELHQDNSLEDLMKELLEKGFNKLDWNDLNQTLKDLFIYLPTVAVKIDEKFYWIISGCNAMIVNNEPNRVK